MEGQEAWNTRVVLYSMQEIKPGRRLSLVRKELWTELTHHSKYRQDRQTGGRGTEALQKHAWVKKSTGKQELCWT